MSFSSKQLQQLCESVFPSLENDHNLGLLVDLPCESVPDNDMWQARRNIAAAWYQLFQELVANKQISYNVSLIVYQNVKSNNADLPDTFYIVDNVPLHSKDLALCSQTISQEKLFSTYQIFMAPTEFSTTAPLKIAAKKFGFRGATMSGFSLEMLPALCLDYNLIYERLSLLKEKLDEATSANVKFVADEKEFEVYFDLRYRSAHVSAGRFPEKRMVGNLPSGETYIVPNEGEKEKSLTEGILPVQFADEIVLFKIIENRAVDVISSGNYSQQEKHKLVAEPAYGNIAELGFGILRDFEIKPIGEVLLDEKLGFHVALGRSNHFGGIVGPEDFSTPNKVVHIDYVYIPETQPKITLVELRLSFPNTSSEIIICNGKYTLWSK